MRKLEGLLAKALDEGRGGIKLEAVEEQMKAAEAKERVEAQREKAHPKAGVRYSIDTELDEESTARVQSVVQDKQRRSVQEVYDDVRAKLKEGNADRWIRVQIECVRDIINQDTMYAFIFY